MINLQNVPREPGVYLFKDQSDKIIYIGKAKNLKNRVSSYFRSEHPYSPKTRALVSHITNAEFIIVDSELEALLLENRLIKQHLPQYNISLKDGRTYSFIQITGEQFPRILTARSATGKGKFFGPYVDGYARREIIELTVKLFKIRTCRILPKKACLNYYIGTCTAPCVAKATEAEYGEQVKHATKFLKGDTVEIQAKLREDMSKASSELKFEIALEKKRQLEAIEKLGQKQKVDLVKKFDQSVIVLVRNGQKAIIEVFTINHGVISGKKEYTFDYETDLFESFLKLYYSQKAIPREIIVNEKFWKEDSDKLVLEQYFEQMRGEKVELTLPEKGEKKALVDMAVKNATLQSDNIILLELQEKLNLPVTPEVIECFDASNLSYQGKVVGMTQFVGGKPNKTGYRKFEVKSYTGMQDDYSSIKEAVFRRYKRLKEENAQMPDLIIIDGGYGQLSSALASLEELGLQLPIISLAKREEEICVPGSETPLNFGKNTPVMLLLRRIRDATHNFVITYNRKKREMAFREEKIKFQNEHP